MNKTNCWEFMSCGRQAGGSHAYLGICPVAAATKLHGVHGGSNGGRACWVVEKTFCNGQEQESLVKKYDVCVECSFFKAVKKEEAADFRSSADLYMLMYWSRKSSACHPATREQ